MTGSWAESKGRSGDSPEFFSFFCKSEANRHFPFAGAELPSVSSQKSAFHAAGADL
jgi:hypothetical protein